MGRQAVISHLVRTGVGKKNGGLRNWHPVDLLAEVLTELISQARIDPAEVDDVICGCVSQIGEQTYNVGRNAWLAAGLPYEVPATTVDRQCGSSQQAIHFASEGVLAGSYELAIACGVESMTRVPMGSSAAHEGSPFSDRLLSHFEGGLVPQGISAEMIADRWNLSRAELDEFSARSHELAGRAGASGVFSKEIVPIKIESDSATEIFETDEGIRTPDLQKIANLPPAFKTDGKITAGNSSQISDGAAAVLITTPEKARALGLTPRARVVALALAGSDPITMLTGPIPATQKVLRMAGLSLDDMDVIEINEAFASVVLAWKKELDISDSWFEERVNVRGGSIAIGHPLGASGARLMTSLVNALEERGGRYGLQTMCEGGGQANATIVERI